MTCLQAERSPRPPSPSPAGSSRAASGPPCTEDVRRRRGTRTGCRSRHRRTRGSARARHRSYTSPSAPARPPHERRPSAAGTGRVRCRARAQRRHRREADARCTADQRVDAAPSTPTYTTTCQRQRQSRHRSTCCSTSLHRPTHQHTPYTHSLTLCTATNRWKRPEIPNLSRE